MIGEILTSPSYAFLRMAFLLSALASISFGLIGSFVVVRRIGYLAGAISHCAFGGIGIGLWLKQLIAAGFGLYGAQWAVRFLPEESVMTTVANGLDPMWVAVLVAVGAALFIGWVCRKCGEREDSVIGIIWSLGMAVGLLFLDKTEGYTSISGYLFGDILLISIQDIITVAILGAVVLTLTLIYFEELKAICFDEEFAKLRNLPTERYFQLLLVLTAVTVVLMLRVVGMVLVIALLTVPAATASRLTKRLGPMIALAIFFCFTGTWTGLYLSVLWNFSAGPMIIVVISILYAAVVLFQTGKSRE